MGFFIFVDMKYSLLILLSLFLFTVNAQDTITIEQKPDSLQKLDSVQNPILTETITTSEVALVDSVLTNSLDLKKKKFTIDRVRIMFGFNFSPYTPLAVERDEFRGAYYPVKDSSPVYTERNTKANLSKSFKTSNIQFFLQANVWKGLFIGTTYQFFTIKNYKKDPNLGNLLSKKNSMFFLVAASFGYVFELLKNKSLQIQPSIRIGGYTADDYYDSGTGKKIYFGADCKIRYLIKRKAGFSIGVDYDFFQYKKKGFNDIFQKNTYQKTNFSNVSLNVGFVYNISINTNKK